MRDPLTKVLHRRGKISEANESRIGREDRREREEVWWLPEKGFRWRGNFHATNEARRGRERSGGRKKGETRQASTRLRDFSIRGNGRENPVQQDSSRWQRVVRRLPRIHPGGTMECRHCGGLSAGPLQGDRRQHRIPEPRGAYSPKFRASRGRHQHRDTEISAQMQLNSAPLVMENAQHQQFTPQQGSPVQTQLSVPPPAADKGASANSGRQQLSYAEVVTQGQTDPVTTETREQRTQRGPEARVQGVDPFKEGRCLPCLARGHVARDCRDPIKCRLCRQNGHRQASCPAQRIKWPSLLGSGHFDGLVGETSDENPLWSSILDGIQATCPDVTSPEYHRLVSGGFLIRGLSKENWQKLPESIQLLPNGGTLKWRRPRATDGAFPSQHVIRRVEARGVPFGIRSWRHIKHILRPVGTLRKLVCDGLKVGDPNCVCFDVEMVEDREVPKYIEISAGRGAVSRILLATLPPPPPITSCPHLASSSSFGALPEQSLGLKQDISQPLALNGTSCGPSRASKSIAASPPTNEDEPMETMEESHAVLTPRVVIDPTEAIEETLASGAGCLRDSLSIYRYRRCRQYSKEVIQAGSSWFSIQGERRWSALRNSTQAVSPLLVENGSIESREKGPSKQQKSQDISMPETFIPASVVLLPALEIGQRMGAEGGDTSVPL